MFFKLTFYAVLGLLAYAGYHITSSQKPLRPQSVEVQIQDIKSDLLLSGQVVNDQTVTITALINGQIASVQVREGELVNKNDVLIQLNSELGSALLLRALAQVDFEEQQVVAERRKVKRFERLMNSNSISLNEFEEAVIALQRSEAMLKIAESDLIVAELQVSNATIKAPFDAIVTHRNTEAGQWVEAGTQLLTLVGTDGNVVEAYVDAGDLGEISYGQSVRMKTDAWPGVIWTSSLRWISPVIGAAEDPSASPNSIAVRFPIGQDAPELLLGQRIDVALETEGRDAVLALPLTVLVNNPDGGFGVWIQNNIGEVMLHEISTGLLTIDRVEIIDGLNEGDRVLSPRDVDLVEGLLVDPL